MKYINKQSHFSVSHFSNSLKLDFEYLCCNHSLADGMYDECIDHFSLFDIVSFDIVRMNSIMPDDAPLPIKILYCLSLLLEAAMFSIINLILQFQSLQNRANHVVKVDRL